MIDSLRTSDFTGSAKKSHGWTKDGKKDRGSKQVFRSLHQMQYFGDGARDFRRYGHRHLHIRNAGDESIHDLHAAGQQNFYVFFLENPLRPESANSLSHSTRLTRGKSPLRTRTVNMANHNTAENECVR
ncbi:hypothetical protein, partial [Schlesneria sp.]|uniref:hypothetical protein n=1 Tax=Schlesneria sp. TaxID=2762018 RepID=UPI002EE916B3